MIEKRLFSHNIAADINEYVKSCKQCQKQGDLKSPKVELKVIPVSSSVIKQVGVDICNLPEVNGYLHVIVLIDHFSKWSEVKPTKDKSALTISQFLYKVMYWHGCFEIQINDRGRILVNEACKQLTWINRSRIERYVCLSPSGERIGRTSKRNNKKPFGKCFGR